MTQLQLPKVTGPWAQRRRCSARARVSFQRDFWVLKTALKSRGLLNDSAQPKDVLASLGEAKFGIRNPQFTPGRRSRESPRRQDRASSWRVDMSFAHWIFTFDNSELETQDSTTRIAAAGQIPTSHRRRQADPATATPQEARLHSTVRDFSAAWWSGALRRARPRSGPAGLFCLRQQQWHSSSGHAPVITTVRPNKR